MVETLLNALNVRVIGTGQTYLVLSHGFGTDQSAWNRILPYFLSQYKVILYDLVCAGSVNPDYFDFLKYTCLDAYADDLVNILDGLGVERCCFVGHSVSAMIGILAAVRRPELFEKLVLIGASPRLVRLTILRFESSIVLLMRNDISSYYLFLLILLIVKSVKLTVWIQRDNERRKNI